MREFFRPMTIHMKIGLHKPYFSISRSVFGDAHSSIASISSSRI